GRHVGSGGIVRVLGGGADVAIDVTKSHASLFLEHRCCGFLKVAQDKSKISQADPLDIVAHPNHIDVGEPARAMSVHSAITSRHSAKGIKANELNSGQEFLSQRGHENRGPSLIRAELDDVPERRRRRKNLMSRKIFARLASPTIVRFPASARAL